MSAFVLIEYQKYLYNPKRIHDCIGYKPIDLMTGSSTFLKDELHELQ